MMVTRLAGSAALPNIALSGRHKYLAAIGKNRRGSALAIQAKRFLIVHVELEQYVGLGHNCLLSELEFFWWAHQDLNLEPTDYESAALTN